jgi:ATP-dependent helicase Lhr and Lhr-like helicase
VTEPFDRLSPAMQYQIVNGLGFTGLRPVQLLTIDAVLDGKNCVVLAPTAGGKTEAAFFPVLSAMDAGDWRPVSTIYLSPIRALLNNQEPRVQRYANLLGRRAFKWHGDTTAGDRKRFLREPADILLTTPESLEAMLMSARVPTSRLFAGLRTVIIDEVHAFADDDRGAHLSAVLERLSRFCGVDVQRIGLSATIGNPEEILRWIGGRSQREGVVVSPPRPPGAPTIALDYVGSPAGAARIITELHRGRKRLVFVDSRSGVENMGRLLRLEGVSSHVTHGSLAVGERAEAERAFQEGTNCVIVATSALELGIDVGDLDHVLQIDCPDSVASFLQRMGRTGRRPGTTPNCTFLATKDWALLQAAALVRLHAEGFVEPVRPQRSAAHILAHQLMALTIQLGGVGRNDWFAWVEGATPFQDLTADDRTSLVTHMLEHQILADQDGRLWLGPEGERLYGRRNFEELYAVFSTPRIVHVRYQAQDLGSIDARFLQACGTEGDLGAFTLGGRAWQVTHIDWPRSACMVRPAEYAKLPTWQGAPRFLSYELCQAMRRVLVDDVVDPRWTRRAVDVIQSLRAEHEFLRDHPSPMVSSPKGITLWTFAGGAANLLLARMIEAELSGKCVVRNVSITCQDEAGQSDAALRDLLARWAAAGRPSHEDALAFAQRSAGRARVSKFQPCLPERLLMALLAEVVTDAPGARRALSVAQQAPPARRP